MEKRGRSVVLVSGGMDSLVAAALAVRETDAAFLHVSYGQRTEARERLAFRAIADHYRIERRLEVPLPALGAIGGSALTDPSIPIRTDGIDRSSIPASYVPFRNAHLVALAVSWAEVQGAVSVHIGAVEEDSSGYPDCRAAFFEALGEAVRIGAAGGESIRIVAPLIKMTKREIVRLGLELGAPFELSWSCYVGGETACGACDSCRLRLRAFRENGVPDPIPYAPGTPGGGPG
ncbi:MAG: 7-cyano-7-deazaguanine synthase QueC [Candidatus Eisenbacteria bacterium]